MKNQTVGAIYAMTPSDEAENVELARQAGERLDDEHTMVIGGTRSLAGRLGRVLEQRIFDRETGPHPPESFVPEYRDYEERSFHVTIVDRVGIAATARNIYSASLDEPTKLETDLGLLDGTIRAAHELERKHGSLAITELATMVIEPRSRLSRVGGWLFGEIRRQQAMQFPGAPSCAMAAPALFRMLKVWGHDVTKLAGLESLEYLGMESQPMFFAPGVQEKVQESTLFHELSAGFFERVHLSQEHGAIDLTTADASPASAVN